MNPTYYSASTQNFVVNAAEAQIIDKVADADGTLTALGEGLEHIDTFFTVIFTMELAINAYAHWFWSFALDGWNVFDSVVVALSLVALGPIAMPINVLRSLRAFRVVRLFGRMSALRNIIASLTAAIVPVLNAFLVMLIVSSICQSSTSFLPPCPPPARAPPSFPPGVSSSFFFCSPVLLLLFHRPSTRSQPSDHFPVR
jgi:hypothetical protein